MSFLQVFAGVVLPIFLIAGAGVVLHRVRPMPPGPLGQVILFLFSPALVFHSLATTQVSVGDMGKVAIFSVLLLVVLYGIAEAASRALRLPAESRGTFAIGALFMNAGNYGLPVSLLAFGQAGLDRAIVFFVIQAVLGWTVGVFLASRARAGLRSAGRAVLTVPTTYAALAGLVVGLLGLPLPGAILKATEVLGAAAVPAMLVVLGLQLAGNGVIRDLGVVGIGVAIRLVVSAAVAYLVVQPLGLDGLTEKVLIVVSGMPTAVFTIILASEYGGRPQLASGMVIASTLASLVTVTVLLGIVGVG